MSADSRIHVVRILGLDINEIRTAIADERSEVVVAVNGRAIVAGRGEVRFVENGIEFAVTAPSEALRWYEKSTEAAK